MKRYFYNVETFTMTLDSIRYNRTHDKQKVVNIVPVFEITEKTDMSDFNKDLVKDSFGGDLFETKEAAQNALNRSIDECLADY